MCICQRTTCSKRHFWRIGIFSLKLLEAQAVNVNCAYSNTKNYVYWRMNLCLNSMLPDNLQMLQPGNSMYLMLRIRVLRWPCSLAAFVLESYQVPKIYFSRVWSGKHEKPWRKMLIWAHSLLRSLESNLKKKHPTMNSKKRWLQHRKGKKIKDWKKQK